MKKIRMGLLALTMMMCWVAVKADLPFRMHRFDSFKVLEVGPDNIVFFGNSITNMHPWCEAFGNAKILNRGNSGAVSQELIDNISSVVMGHPAKLFLMIGTNDLGTVDINDSDMVAEKIVKIIDLVKQGSPETELYVQSILPSSVGIRTLEAEKATNEKVEAACRERGVTYIDLFDEFEAPITEKICSFDGLHLKASGYRQWCNRIAPYVGSDCVYADDYADLSAGYENSYGMRNSYFGMLPVKSDDVLMIGDEMIHGCEWQEIMHCDKIKNRGTGWGYNSIKISQLIPSIPVILEGNGNKEAPAKIFLYAGAVDANAKASSTTMIADYKALVDEIRKYAPETKIYAMSLVPTDNLSLNSLCVRPFNKKLQEYAAGEENIEFIDLYTPLADGGVANAEYIVDNYVYGKGYARISEILAPYMSEEGATPTTVEEATRLIEKYTGMNSVPVVAFTTEQPKEICFDLIGRRVNKNTYGYILSVRE